MNLTQAVRDSRKNNRNLYLCHIAFVDDVLGAKPLSEDVTRKHLMSKFKREATAAVKKGLEPPSEERMEEIIQADLKRMFHHPLQETLEEEAKQSHCGFNHDEFGPYLGDHCVNACFREMLVCLGITGDAKRRGSKQTFQHLMIARGCDEKGVLYEDEQMNRLHFYREKELVEAVDEVLEMAGSVGTPQGKKSILKSHDQLFGVSLHFVIDIEANLGASRKAMVLRDEDVVRVMSSAETNGLGACRGLSHGRFMVTRLERLTNLPYIKGDTPPGMDEKADAEQAA